MPIAGAWPNRSGVVCGVIANDRAREDGTGVTAGEFEFVRQGGDGDVFLSIELDPQAVLNLCCGSELPVLNDREVPGNRASYTYCPVWQAEKDRIEAGREMLSEGATEPEPVAHYDDGRGGTRTAPAGSSYDSPDPWAQARRDLDVLAPPPQGG